MRILLAAAAAFVLSAQFASAAPVTVAPVAIAADLQTEFEDDFGLREIPYLQDYVTRTVTQALTRAGADVGPGAPLTVEITIVEADPNKPTMKQMTDTPGLDYMGSVSIGGAAFTAVLRDAEGAVVGEVSHRRYAPTLDQVNFAGGAWAEARRAARGFATKVARAYEAQTAQAAR